MAKKSMIEREKKRLCLVLKYSRRRQLLKTKIKTTSNIEQKFVFYGRLMKLPKNSSFVRLHNRCQITGRPKGYYRDFGLCRMKLREMFHQGLLPGVSKASW